MMSDHYRRMEADHHHRERRGSAQLKLAAIVGVVSFVALVRCAASLAMTGSLL